MNRIVDYAVYLVTDSDLMSTKTVEQSVLQAIKGGATIIQLREKNLTFKKFVKLAKSVKKICKNFNVPLIINDNINVALEIQADGVHIGQNDVSAKEARRLIGDNMILGVSTATLEESIKAKEDGADYLGVGAMFSTSTKTDARIVSEDELKRIVEQVKIPVVVIGGINNNTIPKFSNIEISGVAVVSAIVSMPNIEKAANTVKELFLKNRKNKLYGVECAVFDLDGTILDSMYVWKKVDKDYLKMHNIQEIDGVFEKTASMTFLQTAKYIKKVYKLKEPVEKIIDDWNQMASKEYVQNVKLKDDVMAYLQQLKNDGIKMAVATSLPEKLLEPVLKNNGIYHLFDAIVCCNEIGVGKDKPDVYLLTMKKAGARAKNSIVFEDVLIGVQSAKKTGAIVCGVFDEYSKNESEKLERTADYFISEWKNAPQLIK